ncbi:hypothetical protein BKA69DRAFT_1091640 [Paraphysoderma sedebokerense]|nr:hypothetical protein BKA69DRAFT_1091640 [Paraphysoderma sedebokerense]
MPPSTRVYIGRLSRKAGEEDVKSLFKGYDIKEVTLKDGFGFVEFNDYKDAEDSVHDFNGKEFFGERLLVQPARGTRNERDRPSGDRDRRRDDRRGNDRGRMKLYKVRIYNLPSDFTWQELKDMMRKAGDVTFTDVFSRDREGFVHPDSYKYLRVLIDCCV